MIHIEFNYNQQITIIQAQQNEQFKNVINSYSQKTLLNPDSLYFLVNGQQINKENTVESYMNQINKQNNKLIVLVNLIEEGNNTEQVFAKSKGLICPICQETCGINLKKYKLSLLGCVNQHKVDDIKIKEFLNTQKINISNIICEKCRIKNKGNSSNYEFYRCLTCKKNLCILCKTNHEMNHKIINYDDKGYLCQKHSEPFIKYCINCRLNLCFSCDEEHQGHDVKFLGDLKPNVEETKNYLTELKKEIDIFSNKIKEIINQLNELIDIMNTYYEINKSLFNEYENQKRNYQLLRSIKKILFDNEIYDSLRNINKIANIKNKMYNIINLYNNVTSDKVSPKLIENKQNLGIKDGKLTFLFPSRIFTIGNSLNSQSDKSECMQISKQINRKALLLVGEINSGKTTLINSFINAFCGLEIQNSFRYVLNKEYEFKYEKKIDTKSIVIYNIDSFNNNPPITIIDTPGFKGEKEYDEKIVNMINDLFKNYIDKIHAICFVANSNYLRLTFNQIKFIFSIFGKDIAQNIIPIFTFNDGNQIFILNSLLKDESIRKCIHDEIIDHGNSFLRFNNSAFFDSNKKDIFTQLFYELNMDNFSFLLTKLNNLQSNNLKMSKSVLETREKLRNKLLEFNSLINQNVSLLEKIYEEKNYINTYINLVENTKNYTIKIKRPKIIKEDLKPGIHTTTCLKCSYTCHENCPYADNEQKKNCTSMDSNGYCKVCPGKCHWTNHKNLPYIIKFTEIWEEKTFEELKRKYIENKNQLSNSEQRLKEIEFDFEKKMVECFAAQNEIKELIEKLNKEALYQDIKNIDEFMDLIIKKEKEENNRNENRIKILESIKQNRILLEQMINEGTTCKNFEEMKRDVIGGIISFIQGKNCSKKLTKEEKDKLCIIV